MPDCPPGGESARDGGPRGKVGTLGGDSWLQERGGKYWSRGSRLACQCRCCLPEFPTGAAESSSLPGFGSGIPKLN